MYWGPIEMNPCVFLGKREEAGEGVGPMRPAAGETAAVKTLIVMTAVSDVTSENAKMIGTVKIKSPTEIKKRVKFFLFCYLFKS